MISRTTNQETKQNASYMVFIFFVTEKFISDYSLQVNITFKRYKPQDILFRRYKPTEINGHLQAIVKTVTKIRNWF